MKKLSVFSTVLVILMSLIFLSTALIAIFSIRTLSAYIYSEIESSLKKEGQLIYNLLPEEKTSPEELQHFADRILIDLDIRMSLIRRDGTVIADSHKNTWEMENHSNRPEFIEAISGKYGSSTRFSSTLHQHMIYITIPPGRKNIIVRVALSIGHIRDRIFIIIKDIIIFSIIILCITIVISILTANSFTSIIRSIENITSFYAKGDFSKKLPRGGPKEVHQLKKSINSMGEQLQEIINKVSFQKNELRVMLNSMADCVILLDKQLNVREMNPAAEKLLQVDFIKCRGLPIQTIIDSSEMIDLIARSLESSQNLEATICFNRGIEQYLLVHSTVIHDSDNLNEGILVVMNNMTRMKQLENMRKDFVANVSHELKTPVTLINGFVETLIDGALEDREKLEQFLSVIKRHSRRITHIIDDLLILSNIEDKGTNISTEKIALYDILFSAYTSALNYSEKENIFIKIDCSDSIFVNGNAILLEQAIFNLINNAIKYAGQNTMVEIIGSITTQNGDNIALIEVKDNGSGIEDEQLERIFERFYRIDRKQSKKLGGTGLGLSIVKHIALAHRGSVKVESSIGQGSTFSLLIPIL